MRRTILLALAMAAAGCGRGPTTETTSKPIVASAPKVHAGTLASPTKIAFTTRSDAGIRQVIAAREDRPSETVALSREGVDTTFGGGLGGGASLLAEHETTDSVVRLVRVAADGTRATLGELVPGLYDGVHEVKVVSAGVFVSVERRASSKRDLFLLVEGKSPKLVASDARIVAASAGRLAYFAGKALKSVASDGSGEIALGAGDDAVIDVTDDRLLVNVGGGASRDVRLETIAGKVVFALAQPGVDEVASGIVDGRIVFSRSSALFAVDVASGTETLVASADLQPRGLGVAPGATALWGDATGALLATDLRDGSSRVLDPDAGQNVAIAKVDGGNVVYVGDTPHWVSLRASALDGSGTNVLCERVTWLPEVVAVQNGTVVFHRNLSAQLEGGRVYAVPVAGGDLVPVGANVVDASGAVSQAPLADQDFEAVTPNGSLVLEAEMEAVGAAQLYVLGDSASPAQLVTDAQHVRFAGIVF